MAPKKRKNRNWPHPRDSSEDSKNAEEIEALFEKKFVLKSKDASWNLPPSSSLFTEERPFILEEMMIMKDRLNQTKSLLNDFDIVQWHQHTRRVNKTGLVVKHLRQELQVEMCTQAWAKFHEILNTYDLIPEEATEAGELFSVHLCEAPGAFVASLNHFLKSRRPQLKWDWLASTLNPYYEGHDLKAMLDDDGFVLETLDHWNFGRDGTGDLMDLANLQALRDASNAKGKVHLVKHRVVSNYSIALF